MQLALLFFSNSTDTGVKTAKTVYNNTTDTTKAVKKVQNAVVSVINYQEGSSSDSLNELYGRIFGGDDSSDSSHRQRGCWLRYKPLYHPFYS